MNTIKDAYDRLSRDREPYLDRGRQAAKLTLPFILPDETDNEHNYLYKPNQSFGSRAVNNLASKLLLTLFPPNRPFFKLSPDQKDIMEAQQELGPDIKIKIEEAMKDYENVVLSELENTPFRSPFFEVFRHLIVVGNVLVFLEKTGKVRVFPLSRYVVRRDPSGNVLEIITMESVSLKTLDEAIQNKYQLQPDSSKQGDEDFVQVFTQIKHDGKKWIVKQEINGKEITETEGSYPLENLPYLALRFIRVDGEDYGRSQVEEYIGDFNALEGLSKNFNDTVAILSRVVLLLRPNGSTKAKDISKAENGAIISGNVEDIQALQIQKQLDLQIVAGQIENLKQELSAAFLLRSSIQREAERVTAEEIRYMARELEDTLGGVYSILAQEMQLPFISILMFRLQRANKIPKLPSSIKPRILTGLEALGRTDERERIMLFLQDVSLFGQEGMGRLNITNALNRLANSHQITTSDLFISDEEYAAKVEAAQMQQMGQQVAPSVAKEVAKGISNE